MSLSHSCEDEMSKLTIHQTLDQIIECARQAELLNDNANVRPFEVDKHGRAIISCEILNMWIYSIRDHLKE